MKMVTDLQHFPLGVDQKTQYGNDVMLMALHVAISNDSL